MKFSFNLHHDHGHDRDHARGHHIDDDDPDHLQVRHQGLIKTKSRFWLIDEFIFAF